MVKVALRLACWDYDRTRPLFDGKVKPEGIDLTMLCLRPRETFDRMLHHKEFDVSELSLASYIALKAGADCPFVAIPVMLSRAFRHSCIFVNTDSGIFRPHDLIGKRVGVPQYGQTAAVYVRGFLQHDYGVHPRDVRWFWRPPKDSPQRMLIPLSLPVEIQLDVIPPGQDLAEMLEGGDLDALVTPYIPEPFRRGSPRVRRLFPAFKAVELDYYRRTHIFPIMHVVAIRKDIYDKHPWVAGSLYNAFSQAKEQALADLYDSDALRVTLPWLLDEIEENRGLLGNDFWPYGLERNRPTLEAAAQYVVEQGISTRKVKIEELFASETL